MKRIGHVIEEIVAQDNLEASFDCVLRGTHRKQLSEGKWLIAHREDFLQLVREQILSGRLHLDNSHDKVIYEAGKWRNIQVFNMKDRIKVNAVMSVVDAHMKKRYIRTTGSSIKGRGMHDLKKILQRDIRDNLQLKYIYKADIRKCYDTVVQQHANDALQRIFKDNRLLSILRQFIFILSGGVGISMGLRSSQGVLNTLLSVNLDHHIKDELRYKYYYRYCDDIVGLFATKEEAWKFRDLIHHYINGIGQKLKPNDRVFPIEDGIDFLGFVIYPNHALMRKRVKKTYARKLSRIKSRKRRKEVTASFYGMAKHGNCLNLLNTLFYPSERNKFKKKLRKEKMKSFKELGLQYQPKDGKKRFNGQQVRLNSIINIEIVITDFERNVTTKHGDNRYLVSFKYLATGEPGKFFTNSEEMKSLLEQAASIPQSFPFKTTIKSEPFENGRGNRFYFD